MTKSPNFFSKQLSNFCRFRQILVAFSEYMKCTYLFIKNYKINLSITRPPPSPATPRKMPLAGTSLKLKKGRRARHRYDSERSLFAFADVDPEDAPEGWDIVEENTSHFR